MLLPCRLPANQDRCFASEALIRASSCLIPNVLSPLNLRGTTTRCRTVLAQCTSACSPAHEPCFRCTCRKLHGRNFVISGDNDSERQDHSYCGGITYPAIPVTAGCGCASVVSACSAVYLRLQRRFLACSVDVAHLQLSGS